MNIPFLPDEMLEERAEAFLAEYLPQRIIPIPIEEILETDFRVGIVPIPGFSDRFGIVGYLSTDQQDLMIDEKVMTRHPARYRFTIAHELAHILLHGDYIRENCPANIADWKRWLIARDAKLYTRMETQANRMAGMMLVPRTELTEAWARAQRYAEERGIDTTELDQFGIAHLAEWIAREFEVSGKVVEIALERCKLV